MGRSRKRTKSAPKPVEIADQETVLFELATARARGQGGARDHGRGHPVSSIAADVVLCLPAPSVRAANANRPLTGPRGPPDQAATVETANAQPAAAAAAPLSAVAQRRAASAAAAKVAADAEAERKAALAAKRAKARDGDDGAESGARKGGGGGGGGGGSSAKVSSRPQMHHAARWRSVRPDYNPGRAASSHTSAC